MINKVECLYCLGNGWNKNLKAVGDEIECLVRADLGGHLKYS